MRIKICGITNLLDAQLCEKYGADAIGYLLYPQSKRYVKPDDIMDINKEISAFMMKIGVFVNQKPDFINGLAKKIGLNTVQLHGDETPEIVKQINLPVIKAFRVSKEFDYSVLDRYNTCTHLLDTYSAFDYGGTGESFDWNQIPQRIRHKIILAGGITMANLDYIFDHIAPMGIDLSSSLELSAGKKDAHKLIKFFTKFNELKMRKQVKTEKGNE